jgi:predicted  nucleic acid-binding Zn-ribbon protein
MTSTDFSDLSEAKRITAKAIRETKGYLEGRGMEVTAINLAKNLPKFHPTLTSIGRETMYDADYVGIWRVEKGRSSRSAARDEKTIAELRKRLSKARSSAAAASERISDLEKDLSDAKAQLQEYERREQILLKGYVSH